MPTDYNDNADKQIIFTETDNYTDSEGNIYADSVPTTTDLDILRAFYKILSGKSIRVSKKDTIEKIIGYLRKELIKLWKFIV